MDKLHSGAVPLAGVEFQGTRFRNYARCLPEYLTSLATQATAKRERILSGLNSADAIRDRGAQVRKLLWNAIGGPETRSDLHPHTVGELRRDGYRVEKVVYESRPGLFITANLYVPNGQGPFPGVLFQCGHYWEGKAYSSYQQCCQGLAQLGFVVLVFDPMGEGERIYYLDASGQHSRLSSCDEEHTVPGKQFLLIGDSATRFQLWDAIRSLDYLLTLPFVDAKHIASVGHSGGGTLTMLLAAADERLTAAAVCMGNTENIIGNPFRAPGATDDAEQNFVDCTSAGFDRWDLFYPFVPKPMLIWPADRDFYATYSPDYISQGWQEYQKLSRAYQVSNRSDCLTWADTPLPHALSLDGRLRVYNWFNRWLKDEAAPLEDEPRTSPEDAATLWATEKGSVLLSLRSRTPYNLITGQKLTRTPAALATLLRIPEQRPNAAPSIIGKTQSRRILIEVLETASDPGVWLPSYVFVGAKTAPDAPVLLVLDELEYERLWFDPEAERTLPDDAPVICAAQVRGVGALAPEFSPGGAAYEAFHQQEENYAWGSLALGRPLAGQRVTDILALVAALRKHPSTRGRPIYLAAVGIIGVPALLAAALEPSIAGAYLASSLCSFASLIETEIPDYPFGNHVPGILNHTDLPEIAASISPRKLTLSGTVNAQGKVVEEQALRRLYGSGNVTIAAAADWSAKGLLSYISTAEQS